MLTAMVLVVFSESIFLIRRGKPTVSAVMISMTLRCSPLNIIKGEVWLEVIEFAVMIFYSLLICPVTHFGLFILISVNILERVHILE